MMIREYGEPFVTKQMSLIPGKINLLTPGYVCTYSGVGALQG